LDAVGTLLFPEPPAPVVYTDVARRHGLIVEPDDVSRRFVAAFRAEEEVDRLSGWVTDEARELARWRRIVADSLPGLPDHDACFRDLFDHFARPSAWRVNSDAVAVFDALRGKGIVLGLASNYDARLWSVANGHSVLEPLRERVVVSATVGHRKPSGKFFAEVIRAVACVDPVEVLLVGDDLGNDYEGARAAGLAAVLLDPRDRHTEVSHRIRTLGELVS
jgi:putative hydrolase of the HAD superfamily